MNIEKESLRNKQHSVFFDDLSSSLPLKEEAFALVQQELDAEKEKRKEERFHWIFGLIISVDLCTFAHMDTWAAPICITFLEFVVLIVLGRRLGVDYIWTLTEKLIDKWNGNFGKASG